MGVFAIDKPAFHFGGIYPCSAHARSKPAARPARHGQTSGDCGETPISGFIRWAAATKGLAGEQLAEIGLMKAVGARAVATGRRAIGSSSVMLKTAALLQNARLDADRPCRR